MMEEWKEYKLGDISTMKYGKLPPTLKEGSFPVWSGYRYVGMAETFNCPRGTVVVVARGVGGTGDVKVAREDCYLTNLSIAVDINTEICNPYYLYYKYQIKNLKYLDSGSAQSQITIDALKNLSIKLPPLNIQNQVVAFLKSLDDKIETNRRINDNLEAQAQALFKSWFVDFEPFRDGEFVESELGMIPKGWRVGTLDEVGDVVGGSTPSKKKPEYYAEKGIAWLTPKDLSISHNKFTSRGEIDITIEGYNSCSTKLMPKGSVLFSSRAPIGYITIAKNEICTNQGFKSVIPKIAGTAFLYYFLKKSTSEIENKATGSTFKEASGSLMKSFPLVIAPKKIMERFEEFVKPILNQQEELEDESSRLVTLRDTLLPRLMSGELKVNEIEREIQ